MCEEQPKQTSSMNLILFFLLIYTFKWTYQAILIFLPMCQELLKKS